MSAARRRATNNGSGASLRAQPIEQGAPPPAPDVRSGVDAPLAQVPLVRAQGEELLLGPLDERELDAVIERTLGTSLLKAALHQLHEVSGGNPFFALEIAKEALRTGRRLTSEELPPIPTDLRKLVNARIGRLDPSTRELLLVVAAAVRPTATLLE